MTLSLSKGSAGRCPEAARFTAMSVGERRRDVHRVFDARSRCFSDREGRQLAGQSDYDFATSAACHHSTAARLMSAINQQALWRLLCVGQFGYSEGCRRSRKPSFSRPIERGSNVRVSGRTGTAAFRSADWDSGRFGRQTHVAACALISDIERFGKSSRRCLYKLRRSCPI